jgi:hypothetical protein
VPPMQTPAHVRLFSFPRVHFAFFPLVWVMSCGGDSPQSTEEGNVLLRDQNNYTAMGKLSLPTIETAPAVDLDICWTDVTDDIQCHAVNPLADIDNVAMLRMRLTEDQAEMRLAAGDLPMSEVSGYVDYHTEKTSTCGKLSQLSFLQTKIIIADEYKEAADTTYLMLFAKGTKPGIGARVMTFLRPTSSSTNTRVDAPKGCNLLDFTANLSLATKVDVPAGGPWVVGWRDITRDGQGNNVVFERIDGVTLGFYEGMSLAEIEAQIFDIELIATSLWDIRLTSGSRIADLATATERTTGTTFSGFTTAMPGVWLLALRCSNCQNPAPVVLAVLNPVGAA